MSGHSKWSQIRRQKGANDAARSAVFGKMARRITVESKKAEGDITSPSLRAAVEKAREANMPKENIERAIAKGTSPEASSLESVVYETYGPGGAAIIIEALTDNKNRTSAEIKHTLSKNGLTLAHPGSALWAFDKKNTDYVPKTVMHLSEADSAQLTHILDVLDEHGDVENFYTNTDITT